MDQLLEAINDFYEQDEFNDSKQFIYFFHDNFCDIVWNPSSYEIMSNGIKKV